MSFQSLFFKHVLSDFSYGIVCNLLLVKFISLNLVLSKNTQSDVYLMNCISMERIICDPFLASIWYCCSTKFIINLNFVTNRGLKVCLWNPVFSWNGYFKFRSSSFPQDNLHPEYLKALSCYNIIVLSQFVIL
jgi:hypothetical protein